MEYAGRVLGNGELAEALFQLGESHPAGELRLALMRAAYAVFDLPRELGPARRVPEAIPLEVLPTFTMLRGCRTSDALDAAVARLSGGLRAARIDARAGFLTAAEVAAALTAPAALPAGELRGAVHFHTRASDGAASLETMARTALRGGAAWSVVSDHTRGLECVNGLDDEGVRRQARALAAWNRRHGDDHRLLHGLEAEILADGSLDLPRAARQGVLVLAAIHTGVGDRRDQTGRLLRALGEPGIWALAHPQGRLFARRSGIRANWELIFGAAAAAGVLIEINGFPRRQDLDVALIGLALASGCRLVLASDAHHPRHLAFDRTALALATHAHVPRSVIVNFDPLDRLLDRLPEGATA